MTEQEPKTGSADRHPARRNPWPRFPAGVSFYDLPIQIDERGSVRELFDLRWNWHPDPLVFVYCFTIRAGGH